MLLVGRVGPRYYLSQEATVSVIHNSFDACSEGVKNVGEAWRHSLLIKEKVLTVVLFKDWAKGLVC